MKQLFLLTILLLSVQPKLSCESLSLDTVMTPEEQQELGLDKATDAQRAAFESWLNNWTMTVIQQAPTYRENVDLTQWVETWPAYASPVAKATPEEIIQEKKRLNRVIDKIMDKGATIELKDGSVWFISEVDRYKTVSWQRGNKVTWTQNQYDIAHPYLLRNVNRDETAGAEMKQPPSETGEREPLPADYFEDALRIQDIVVNRTQSTSSKVIQPNDVFITLEDGTTYRVAPIDMMQSQDWKRNDRVRVENSDDYLYEYQLTNLDTGQQAKANIYDQYVPRELEYNPSEPYRYKQ